MESRHASTSIPSSSRGPALRRGKACIRCRRRKMKCDGARPVCSQCIEANRIDDCEYTDNQGTTRTQMLEENIARLESRLQELEGDTSSGQPLFLHDPYSARATSAVNNAEHPESSSLIAGPEQDAPPEELPWQTLQTLISVFLPFSKAIGFAIDPAQFRECVVRPIAHLERPHAALINAVCLWALRISNSMELRQQEDLYLQRAILALQNSPDSHSTSRYRLEAVQAEILLAQYFFCLGHNIEGRYHANAAVTLALSCSLHRIGSSSDNFDIGSGSHSAGLASSVSLSPPRDAKERGERIRVFWATFDLDSCWSTALEGPHSFSDDITRGTQIDTPWSDEVGTNSGGGTVQNFLSGYRILENDNSFSIFRSKASALYGRAARASGRIRIGMSLEEEVQGLARITAEFTGRLPRLDELNSVGDDDRVTMAVTHGLTHASMIHLHRALASVNSQRTQFAYLPHANEIVEILEFASRIGPMNNENMRNVMLDPILAVCGLTAGRAFTGQLDRIGDKPRTYEMQAQRRLLRARIDQLIDTLRRCSGFANVYPVFAQNANAIEDELPGDLFSSSEVDDIS